MTAAPDVDTVTVVTARSAVDRLVAEGARIAGELGSDWAAAGSVLTEAPASAVRELAQSKLAELIRARLRSGTLAAERAAERAPRPPRSPWLEKRIAELNADLPPLPTPEERRQRAAEREAERVAGHERRMQEINDQLQAAIAGYKAALRMEWTAELLNSTIALPDGTRTTWGAATVEQLKARAAMLVAHAAGTAESAARVLCAVDELEAAGVDCLNDLVGATA